MTYRTGHHHGVTIINEASGIRCARQDHDCARGHLAAIVVDGGDETDEELAERICRLLNTDVRPHQEQDHPEAIPFGFTVTKTVNDDDTAWAVSLPHQCDYWDIAGSAWGNAVSHADAVTELERFIAEAQNALQALKDRREVNGEALQFAAAERPSS